MSLLQNGIAAARRASRKPISAAEEHEEERRKKRRKLSPAEKRAAKKREKQRQREAKEWAERRQDWRVAGLPPPRGDNAPPVEHRDRVLTFRAWCQLNAFSLATGRRLMKRGEGPRVLQLSPRRVGIKESDNRRWQEARARS